MTDTMPGSDRPGSDQPQSDRPGPGAPPRTNPLDGLVRSDQDKWIAGVAGGVARRFSVETWVVRVGFVVLTFVGIGLPLYVLAWILLPSDSSSSFAQRRGWSRNTMIAIAIVLIVVFGTMASWGDDAGWLLPWALVGLGVWLLVRDTDQGRAATPPQVPVAGAPVAGAPVDDPGQLGTPVTAPYSPVAPPPPPPYSPITTPMAAPAPPPPPRPKRRSFLAPLTVFLLVAYAGIAAAVGNSDGTRWDEPGVVAAVSLITIGAVLVLSTWIGRARGLIVAGVLLLAPVTLSFATDGGWRDWRGDVTIEPTTAIELRDHYEWGFGHRRLDLRDLRLEPGTTESVEVDQIAGELEILLPEDGVVRLDASVGAGQLSIQWPDRPDTQRDGFGPSIDRRIVTGTGGGRIDLDVQLGAGQIRVTVPEEAN
ncbi:MAG TPA: PspC domain-containing protein [Microthrixaceae bacterium]|nr:PspC domain-containing protein [Microthrixaceae bacterium]